MTGKKKHYVITMQATLTDRQFQRLYERIYKLAERFDTGLGYQVVEE